MRNRVESGNRSESSTRAGSGPPGIQGGEGRGGEGRGEEGREGRGREGTVGEERPGGAEEDD